MDESLFERVRARARDPLRRFDINTNRPLPETLSMASLRSSERDLGFAVPSFLVDLYGKVANGGFGPGYGFLGLDGGWGFDGGTAVGRYRGMRSIAGEDPNWRWPENALPVINWGCAINSYIDCDDPTLPVTWFDPNPYGPDYP